MVVWRPVLERVATLHEIETHWSLDDLLDANDALDAWQEAQAQAQNRSPR